eukprot:CAMPEP_0116154740 /NCGR_PEP_ID=MMETSP0329-20121206/21941_1 /TAXON_ID=697910 /ORGANISM="Pseudo-nitzschia arenysensis, Strain B593" /LENGTH=392 /DNA_ID=CAMNT_0003651739 /DNA_START=55 /DNA_END=1231 /DNA_ORIENTATION=-
MPFLLSSSSRKKKSYIHDDSEESARRREMIKHKLYAEHMIGDDEHCDDYLERRLNSKSPVRRLSRANSNRRIPAPNYIDPSGSLRQSPPSSGHFGEQNGKKTLNGTRPAPPLPPRRTSSFSNRSGELTSEAPITPTRFSMAPHPNRQRQSRLAPRVSSRLGNQPTMQDEDEGKEGEMMLTPVSQRRPPPRRRRATDSSQTLQRNADAAMRFGPPRRVKSHYPGGHSPKSVAQIGMMDTLDDYSEHSRSSRDCSEKSSRRGLFRRKSGHSSENDDAHPSSSSFFRKVKRNNSSSLKKVSGMDSSDHTSESQKSWFTSGSGRSKEDIYNSARHRANERQAIKNAQNYLRGGDSIGNHNGKITLSEQLSRLPPANDSDDEYEEEEDEGTESKSIF